MRREPVLDPGELFFLHSSYVKARSDPPEPDRDLWPGHFRTYPGAPRYALPSVGRPLGMPLGQALASRRTVRDFELGSLALETLARLLHASYGVSEWSKAEGQWLARRPVPSAGALYPLEIYVAAQRIEGLPDGLFHYDPRAHVLELRERGNLHPRLARLTWVPDSVARANLVILITGVIPRTTWKYGLRGYRFLWMEAGHLGQNLLLAARALGLGALPVGGFSDQDVDRAAGLTADERTLYLVCVGISP